MSEVKIDWVEKGFEKKKVEMMVRKNGNWVQVVVVKDGKESYWIMKRVESLLDRRDKKVEDF
jgi:hypothetical protein